MSIMELFLQKVSSLVFYRALKMSLWPIVIRNKIVSTSATVRAFFSHLLRALSARSDLF